LQSLARASTSVSIPLTKLGWLLDLIGGLAACNSLAHSPLLAAVLAAPWAAPAGRLDRAAAAPTLRVGFGAAALAAGHGMLLQGLIFGIRS